MASRPKFKLSGSWPKSTWKTISPEELKPLRELYKKARFLDVYERAQSLGPLQTWMGEDARNFAADLAGFLAGYRLSDWLDVTSYRHTPRQEDAELGYSAWLRARRGPLIAWWFLDGHLFRPEHGAWYKFRWLSQRASIALNFRDFELAKKFADEAEVFCERPELVSMARCFRFRAQDRVEDALAEAHQAHALNPTHTAAYRQIAEILLMQNRDQECLSYLADALERTQDSYLLSLRVRLQIEREQFREVLADLDLYEKWTPLIELEGRHWLAARRADACYHLDQFDEAIRWAEEVGHDFYNTFTERLRVEMRRTRVRLSVGFIRQDHHTCGPATLTALANFWGLPADHGKVVESICYDGTYDYQERQWVEENGFFVREFKVTWDASRQLIDLGIPFALATSWPGGAHLQAVIGYDAIWQNLIIRDPGERDLGEFDWKKTEEMYRAIGPRGMAFVPVAKKELLEKLDLPDAALFDANYQISLALHRHQREAAVALCADLETRHPGERLTIIGRRLVADYDNNVPEQLACVQKLLQLFPGDERHSLTLLSSLREIGRSDERLALLHELTRKKDCDPLFWKELAIELSDDSREQKHALKHLRKAHRALPHNGPTASRMADILWNRGKISRATDIYRFVACVDDKWEAAARSYFTASRQTRRTEEAIRFLKARFLEYGPRSPYPIRTLFFALEQLDRVPEAFAELEVARTMRPKDGELLCYIADVCRRYGKKDESRKILADAEQECPRARWLRTSALLARESGDLAQALKLWEETATLEPLSEEAHREIADLLSKTQGRKEALAYLRTIHEKFPFNMELGRLLLSWLKNENRDEAIALCRLIATNHPSDAWAVRELASQLGNVPERLEDALAQAKLGRDLEPRATYAYNILGDIHRKLGRVENAKEAFREAIRLRVDNSYAIERLIDLGTSQEDKRRDLLFVREELVRQVVFGDGLAEFRQQAQRALPPEEVLGYLQEAREKRPDLWQAWSSLTYQYSHMGRPQEALALAGETAERFPLVAGSWRNLGDMHSQLDHWADAAAALEKAVALSSDWIPAITELSDACQRQGDPARAQTLLENSLRNNPTSSVLRGYLADLLFHEGNKKEALAQIQRAVEIDPHYKWGIGKLRDWGTREQCLEVCRALTQTRPGEAHSWRTLADHLDAENNLDEMLQALDRAIALEPQDVDSYDIKAQALSEHKRFEEALAVCRPLAWGGFIPVTLRGRAAWIENERGDPKKAIAMMEKVVADDSTYYWGWGRLSDWLSDEKRVPEAVRAADHMVQLSPGNSQPFGYRADARLKQGNRSGAIEDLRRAHLLDPDYNYATWKLFDLILDDEEYKQAGILLEDARRCSNPSKILAAEIRLELAQKHTAGALAKLKAFGASPEATVDTVTEIQKEFQQNDALENFDLALGEMISSRAAMGPILYVWIRRKAARRQWDVAPVLDHYLQHDRKIARFGVESFLHCLGDNDHFHPYLMTLVRDHGAWIAENSYTWGLTGFALNSSGKHAACAAWLAGWKTRTGVERWMLINLTQSLRNLNREAESAEVNRRVVEIETQNVFANLYLAFDLACGGDLAAAESHLQRIEERDLRNDMKLYLLLTREIIAFSKTGQRPSFDQAKHRLDRHRTTLSRPPWEFERAYYLGLARLAELSGKFTAHLYRLRVGRLTSKVFHRGKKRRS